MDDFLLDLEHASKTPAKQRSVKINTLIDNICSDAYENGLSTAQLGKIVDIITLPNALDQATTNALIKNLYPKEKVPDVVVVNIVASLGHGIAKPNHSVQAALLRWLIMVYGVFENQKTLSQLYAVLFNLLDTLVLRTPLCHVLSLITRRKHVRPFRIQILMELTRQFGGNDAPLVGLLRVYKDYYPDVIVREAVAGRAKVFTHPNEEWRQRLSEIQESHAARTTSGSLHDTTFKVSHRNGVSARRARSSLIPNVQTSNASETSVTLEEIDNVDDFVQKLERVEPPNQLIAAIKDPLLQKYLQLRSSEEHVKRIDMWLLAFFEDRLSESNDDSSQTLSMLDAMLQYTRFTKVLPDACATYLRSILETWNGVTGQAIILELLTYLSPDPAGSYEALQANYFQPLEDALLSVEANDSYTTLLRFYTTLLDRWSTHTLAHQEIATATSTMIQNLIDHGINLTLAVSQKESSQASQSAILSFYESLNAIFSNDFLISAIRITTPPSQLVYNLQFTSSLTTLNRLCAILASYKTALEAAIALKNTGSTTSKSMPTYSKAYLNHYNGYLMDICNCLWRGKALQTTDTNSLGCLIDANVTNALSKYVATTDSLTMPWLFSFSTSPMLCAFAITYMRGLEDRSEDNIEIRHAGPVTQASSRQLEVNGGLKLSWQDYRLGVLQYLESVGAAGVGSLMYNTMKHLMVARNQVS